MLDRFSSFLLPVALSVGVVAGAAGLVGCTPHIGDHCNLNTDCSIQGTLLCDTSQPNGYCTFFNCAPNSCQNGAVCVMLHASVPGCPYDDYQAPSRTARTMCLAPCSKNSDCRTGEGYECADPTQAPWDAIIIDSNNLQKVCLVNPSLGVPASFDDAGAGDDGPNVCQATGPDVPPIDAGVSLADGFGGGGADGGDGGLADSGAADGATGDDGGAGSDGNGGSDGGDATVGPGDAGVDAPADAGADATGD